MKAKLGVHSAKRGVTMTITIFHECRKRKEKGIMDCILIDKTSKTSSFWDFLITCKNYHQLLKCTIYLHGKMNS